MVGDSPLRESRGVRAPGVSVGAGSAALVILTAAGVLVLAGALLVVAVPLVLVLALVAAVARWGRRLRAPNGLFDRRRNVRVIVPGAHPTGTADRG